ncbi:MAG: hypothetical protein DWQ02_20545 [Bacteroidetes bacterium]|nr:MAG: hypothetical protein DWQ02_20545 [Bacteroidota bacterium]
MKTLSTEARLFLLLITMFVLSVSACQKEVISADLADEIIGSYEGEYREGEDGFTVIVSNVIGTATKTSSESIEMELELVPGIFTLDFSAQMETSTTFVVEEFELDGDMLEGEGVLEENILEISFYEAGTLKPYGSYVAEKQ